MSHIIHTRKCGDDVKFRVWSTNTDSYVTEELNEQELREVELNFELERTVAGYFREIDIRIERAIRNGTSSRHTTRQNLNWDTERV